jgi:sporulation protein YunB
LVVLISFLLFTVVGYYQYDRKVMPLVLAQADIQLRTTVNAIMLEVIQRTLAERGVTASDLYVQTPGAGNVTVNTMLVNEICALAAAEISEALTALTAERMTVPLGVALGLDTLAQWGPRYGFNMRPVGTAAVNYYTRMESAGINQVHFELWLTVQSTVRIINPVLSAQVEVSRDIALLNTLITGDVPHVYVAPGAVNPVP